MSAENVNPNPVPHPVNNDGSEDADNNPDTKDTDTNSDTAYNDEPGITGKAPTE